MVKIHPTQTCNALRLHAGGPISEGAHPTRAGRLASLQRCRCRTNGLAYVWTLLLVALFAAATLAVQPIEKTLTTRSREADLLWVGEQFRKAIRDYYLDSQGLSQRYPRTLDELLGTRRGVAVRRYLRRIYVDPMSGTRDWGLLRTQDGGITGVYSQATGRPIRTAGFSRENRHFSAAKSYRDWTFSFDPAAQ